MQIDVNGEFSCKNIQQLVKDVEILSTKIQEFIHDEDFQLPLDQRALVYAFNKILINQDQRTQELLLDLVSNYQINQQVANQLASNNKLLQLLLNIVFPASNISAKVQVIQLQINILSKLLNTVIIDEDSLLKTIVNKQLYIHVDCYTNIVDVYKSQFLSQLNIALRNNNYQQISNATEYVNRLILNLELKKYYSVQPGVIDTGTQVQQLEQKVPDKNHKQQHPQTETVENGCVAKIQEDLRFYKQMCNNLIGEKRKIKRCSAISSAVGTSMLWIIIMLIRTIVIGPSTNQFRYK
ncbi:Hypothetical_protein [Hexamita inflata]|uniref:Hypothetical_protein n=1 Tax=Hexamita inflata TaxID=28002 RepID=A0AA86RKX4_9EUKA|nr:Hypothetical protein HINF_LOCUS66222 [Hexamita inflata]